jgi:hypothetical protein
MSKKVKRYDGEDGSVVETDTTQGQNTNIGDDVRARAMAAMANRESAPTPAPSKKEVGKAITKAAKEEKAEPKKANPVQQAKDVVSGSGMFSKFRSPGAALASYEQAGPKRSELTAPVAKRSAPKISTDSSDAYKRGGKVSSASKRADGCCIRGKTRA